MATTPPRCRPTVRPYLTLPSPPPPIPPLPSPPSLQVGIFYPFFRGHAHLETQRREPWLFGEPATTRIREAIRERYSLLPYIYTLFRHANMTGQPVLRPLWFEFPDAKGG